MKSIPKVHKNLSKHLTEESKDMMLKTAVGVTTGVLLAGALISDVSAGHTNNYPTSTNPAGAYPYPSDSQVPSNSSASNLWTVVNSATCNHVSGIVNGHMSNTPAVSINSQKINYIKSHNNHSNHSSGGWC